MKYKYVIDLDDGIWGVCYKHKLYVEKSFLMFRFWWKVYEFSTWHKNSYTLQDMVDIYTHSIADITKAREEKHTVVGIGEF